MKNKKQIKDKCLNTYNSYYKKKKMKISYSPYLKLIIAGIFLCFLLPLYIAEQESLGTFKQNTCIELVQTCSNCSYVSVTSIVSPDSTKSLSIIDNFTRTGTDYNYTFCNTTQLGKYIVNGFGDTDGIITVFAYDFNITTTGNNNNNTIPLFLVLGGFIILIFAFVFKNNYLGFMAGVAFIIFGIYSIVYGLGFVSDFYTEAIGYVTIGLGLFIFLASAYSAINDTGVNLLGEGSDGDEDY